MINIFNWVTNLVEAFTFYGGGGKGGGGGGSSEPVDFFGRDKRGPYEKMLGQLLGVYPLPGTSTSTTSSGRNTNLPDGVIDAGGGKYYQIQRGPGFAPTYGLKPYSNFGRMFPSTPTTTTSTQGGSMLDFIKNQPGYQFQYEQGLDALNRQFASTGQSVGGNQAIALQNFGNKYAGDYYQRQISNLMGASGATMGAGASSIQNPQMGSSPFGQVLGTGLGMWGQSGFSGLFGGAAASTAAGGLMTSVAPALGGLAFSDRNLKRDIKLVDVIQGHKIYTYKYIWSNQDQIGVIAQDLLETNKDAVTMNKNGYYMVDYSKLGV